MHVVKSNRSPMLDLCGRRHAMEILAELAAGPARYTSVKRALDKPHARTLTDTLRYLQGEGLVVQSESVYALTEAGVALVAILARLQADLDAWHREHGQVPFQLQAA
ncbi:winged helix-turn-helix transcriptional regulator [Longispora albida]|uniref:winged helix-turn-helix transcriptional regulator n=1 Tax=Longispora albida TaxID=203523 RepID=UPI00039E0ECF|nr:winged helix-turn-helix transcriptional regulator [Longispora albida]